MAARGAQPGNQNAKKAKVWENAIRRSLARLANGKGVEAGLDELADKLVSQAAAGEQWALIEVGNRMDGKPAQVIIGDDDESPVRIRGIIDLIKPGT